MQISEKVKKRIADAIIYIILGTLCTFPIIITILAGTTLEYDATSVFLICLIFTVVTALVFFNKQSLIASSVVLVLFSLLTYAETFAKDPSETLTNVLVQKVYNTYWFAAGFIPYEQEYVTVIVAAVALLVTLLATISLYWSFSFYPMFVLGSVIFIISWIFNYLSDDIYILIFLLSMSILFMRKLNSSTRKKNQNVTDYKFTFIAIPICVAVFAICVAIPKPQIKYNRDAVAVFFENPVNALQEIIYFTFNPKYFSVHTTGFGDRSGRLGGKVVLNKREVMKVYSDEKVYLVGGYKDIYTGDRWIGSFADFVPYEDNKFGFSNEAYEAIKNFITPSRWSEDELVVSLPIFGSGNVFAFRNQIQIDIGRAKTGTIFTVANASDDLEIIDQPDIKAFINGNNSLRASRVLPQDAKYSFTYTVVDQDNRNVFFSLYRSYNGFYNDVLSGGYPMRLNSELRAIYEDFAQMAADIRKTYTNLPDTLPQRVYDLADEITSGLSMDYDKVKAIEKYLVENYTYSLDTESLPYGEDFVDSFLFGEKKEGYCVYFATSMAVLCRAAGIPTRYVEGYALPNEKANDEYYIVTGENTHAWVDVYFEGFGWVAFEPTPPMHYSLDADTPPSTDIFSDSILANPEYDKYLRDLGLSEEYLEDFRDRQIKPQDSTQQGDAAGRADKKGIVLLSLGIFVIILLSCIGLLVLYALYKALKIALFFYKVKKMPICDQAVEYFNRILKIWAYDGYIKLDHETPAAFVKKLPYDLAAAERDGIKDSVNSYYKALFSRDGITNEELDGIKEFWCKLYKDHISTKKQYDTSVRYFSERSYIDRIRKSSWIMVVRFLWKYW